MTVVIVLCAFAVTILAALAGTGRFGQWQEVVTDSPKGYLPDGRLDQRFLEKLVIPIAPFGYQPKAVDDYLRRSLTTIPPTPVFDIVRRGYDMAFVDELLTRTTIPAEYLSQLEAEQDSEIEESVRTSLEAELESPVIKEKKISSETLDEIKSEKVEADGKIGRRETKGEVSTWQQ